MFRDHAEAFMYKRGTWFVPSENGCSYYAVRLGRVEVFASALITSIVAAAANTSSAPQSPRPRAAPALVVDIGS